MELIKRNSCSVEKCRQTSTYTIIFVYADLSIPAESGQTGMGLLVSKKVLLCPFSHLGTEADSVCNSSVLVT